MIELLLQAERAMSVGSVDRAETLYEQVAAADPQNSIAVVGLARVVLERGDETGALVLARRALAIDPENAAASRIVERLEEVLRQREAEEVAAAPPAVASEPAIGTPIAPLPESLPESLPAQKRRSLLDRLLRRR